MTTTQNPQNLPVYLGIIQLLVGIGAIPAGFSMVMEPSGEALGMSTDLLHHAPFPNFLIPGLFLLLIHGFLNIGIAILSFKRKPYSGTWGMILGGILMLWIIVQVYMIGLLHVLQPLYFSVGLAEAILGYVVNKRVVAGK